MSTQPERRALVVCYSNLEYDPRVTRQIDWLISDGWTVDSLGFGAVPTVDTHRHFPFEKASWVARSSWGKAAIHTLLPYSARFRLLVESQIPHSLEREKPAGGYDLILVNDIDLLPWAERQGTKLLSKASGAKIHLDVHEFHTWAPDSIMSAFRRRMLGGYHSWLRAKISSSAFSSRSTVADGIAALYSEEFGITQPSIVRNSPAFVDQRPSAVQPDRIRLIYHGNAEMARGLELLIDAFRLMDERFTLTLMLTGSVEGKQTLRSLTSGLGKRLAFIDPVPMADVATKINAFDLEVIFYPPSSPNYKYSFPNKFFESVQGRLGVVIGDSPSMTAIVSTYHNGVVVNGWQASDLARTVNLLTPEEIEDFKSGSDRCATHLNAGVERENFLRGIRGVTS